MAGSAWCAYLVNLDRSTARRDRAERELEKESVPFVRFPAIDALDVSDETIAAHLGPCDEPSFKRALIRAEIACFLSHRAVWREIADGDAEMAFVFEDDVQFVDGAGRVLHEIAGREPEWDILRLHSNKPRRLMDRKALVHGYETGTVLKPPALTIGYAITRPAAAQLLKTTQIICRPLDMELKLWWKHGLCTRVISPSICGPNEDAQATSTIEPGRATLSKRHRVRRMFANLKYQVASNLLVWRNRRKQPANRQYF